MDKAPDAFRTISEVADELDIPQHVLRFWETRFAQIKPMKRSGGRRYYRPDDVDLLKGIRRLLYGEGYTIRGVQRILKEHGVKAVQGLSDSSVAASFGAVEKRLELTLAEDDGEPVASFEGDTEDEDYEGGDDGIDFRFLEHDADGMAKGLDAAAGAGGVRSADRSRLESVLQELIAARQLLDQALKDG